MNIIITPAIKHIKCHAGLGDCVIILFIVISSETRNLND